MYFVILLFLDSILFFADLLILLSLELRLGGPIDFVILVPTYKIKGSLRFKKVCFSFLSGPGSIFIFDWYFGPQNNKITKYTNDFVILLFCYFGTQHNNKISKCSKANFFLTNVFLILASLSFRYFGAKI